MNNPTEIIESDMAVCQSVAGHRANHQQGSFTNQVTEFYSSITNTRGFTPRWYCGEWSPFHGWLYIISDFLIWLAYFTIPAILFFFLHKKKEQLPFKGLLIFFITFILLCGLTHLIDVAIFWWPVYRLSALIRFGTAIVSLGTVFALVKFVPRALELKSPQLLEKMVEERARDLVLLNKKYEEEIHERKIAEHEVLRLNKELKDFRQAITNSSIISITDKSGIINYVNDNFIEISGYGEDELLGKNHRIINSGHHKRTFWVDMWQTISKGKTWREEVKNRAKDGSFYWVDTFIMPFKNEDGQINQFLSIRNNITDRKYAEDELRKLNNSLELRVEEKIRDIKSYNERLMQINELFESVQSHAHIGVWEYTINSQRLYLYPESKRVLQIPENHPSSFLEILKLIHKNDRRKVLDAIKLCLNKGEKYDFELLITTFQDHKRWVRTTGIPDYQGDEIVKIKGLIQDIDLLKMKEHQLEESKTFLTQLNTELESFSYSVSHDLRAPLRYINGYTKILEEEYADVLDKDGNEILQVIVKNTIKMGHLIDDLLDFSRLGRKEMLQDECDMENIVRDIIQEHILLRKENSTEITIYKLLTAKADYTMIRQVWVNLISNSFKYSGKREKICIEIGSKEEEDDILYYIKDNGVGFDPAYKHKLFGVFQRLHKVEEFSGTGVGLAIVQRIVSRHNGKVWADAQVDAGATFYFTLPK